jgi:hypothetical protein
MERTSCNDPLPGRLSPSTPPWPGYIQFSACHAADPEYIPDLNPCTNNTWWAPIYCGFEKTCRPLLDKERAAGLLGRDDDQHQVRAPRWSSHGVHGLSLLAGFGFPAGKLAVFVERAEHGGSAGEAGPNSPPERVTTATVVGDAKLRGRSLLNRNLVSRP